MLLGMSAKKVRRTVTIDATLAAAIDQAIAQGAADHVSGFLSAAAAAYLRNWNREQMVEEAAKLDPAEEAALLETTTGQPAQAVLWSGLREG